MGKGVPAHHRGLPTTVRALLLGTAAGPAERCQVPCRQCCLDSPLPQEPMPRLHPKTGLHALIPNGIKSEPPWGPLERGRCFKAQAYCPLT